MSNNDNANTTMERIKKAVVAHTKAQDDFHNGVGSRRACWEAQKEVNRWIVCPVDIPEVFDEDEIEGSEILAEELRLARTVGTRA